jgi:hypothetical protein
MNWLPYERLALGGLVLLAALLRFYRLDAQPVWCDETYFLQMAMHDGFVRTVLQTIVQDVYPPLFFLLLHAQSLVSLDIAWLRLPMVLAGIAGVVLLWSILRRHFGPRAALLGGALAAVSPVLVFYTHEAKPYALLALLLLLLLDECLRCLEDPKRGWGRLALWAALSIYTFYLSALLWVSFLLAAAWLRRGRWGSLRSLWLGFGVAALAFLPWAPFFLKSVVMNRGSVLNLHMDRIVLYSLQNFSVGFWASPALAWASLPFFGGLAAWGLLRGGQPRSREALRFLGLACLLPLLISWAASLLMKPTYADRAMLVCALAWSGLLGIGLARLPSRLGAALAVLALGLPLGQLWRYHNDPTAQRMDYRPAWERVIERWQPGDAIFHEDIASYYPFKLFALQEARDAQSPYFGGVDRSFAATVDPAAPGLRPNWMDLRAEEPFPDGANEGAVRRVWRSVNARLKAWGYGVYASSNRDFVAPMRRDQEALAGVKRIWFVSSQPEARRRMNMPQINLWRSGHDNWPALDLDSRAWLQQSFELLEHAAAGEAELRLFKLKERP